jgi:hypothetical protein
LKLIIFTNEETLSFTTWNPPTTAGLSAV